MYATQIHYNRSNIYSARLWKFDHNGVDWYLIQRFSMGCLLDASQHLIQDLMHDSARLHE